MRRKLFAALLFTASTMALAENIIVTQTKGWKSVPITVDETNHTYTMEGTLPGGNYYYSYPGYRCIKEKRDYLGVNAIMFHAGFSGGNDIYCYPE